MKKFFSLVSANKVATFVYTCLFINLLIYTYHKGHKHGYEEARAWNEEMSQTIQEIQERLDDLKRAYDEKILQLEMERQSLQLERERLSGNTPVN